MPRITVGITCFNAEDTIQRAVESALAQDWYDLEIVIVDDASTDQSRTVVENTIEGVACARLMKHDRNLGTGEARNTILKEATGAFVAFFDDDDESAPNRLAEQYRRIVAYEKESGAQLVACYARGRRVYENGYVVNRPAIGPPGARGPVGYELADYLLFFHRLRGTVYGTGVPSSGLMARIETFDAVSGFDATFRRVEDLDLAVRLAYRGAHFIGTGDCLYTRYASAGLDKSSDRNFESERALAEKHRNYLRGRRRYYYATHWPKLRYWHFRRRYGRFLVEFFGLLLRHPVASVRHVLATGPARLAHERRIAGKRD